jgi:hypothetical protein
MNINADKVIEILKKAAKRLSEASFNPLDGYGKDARVFTSLSRREQAIYINGVIKGLETETQTFLDRIASTDGNQDVCEGYKDIIAQWLFADCDNWRKIHGLGSYQKEEQNED